MDQMFPFMHAFNKYSLSIYYVSDTALGPGILMNKINSGGGAIRQINIQGNRDCWGRSWPFIRLEKTS